MKRKVLTYTSDYNTLKDATMNLEQKRPHVYVAENCADDGDYFQSVVLNVGGVFFCLDQYPKPSLSSEAFDRAEQLAGDYVPQLLKNERLYPRAIDIELVRRLGMTDGIDSLRERRRRLQNEREQDRRREQQLAEQRRIEAGERRYRQAEQTFMEGKLVSNEDFAEMLRRHKIPVPPKTKHLILHHCTQVRLYTIKGITKGRCYDTVFRLIEVLYEKLSHTVYR